MTNEALRSKTTSQPTELAKSANSLRATKNSGNESKEALENDSVWRLSATAPVSGLARNFQCHIHWLVKDRERRNFGELRNGLKYG